MRKPTAEVLANKSPGLIAVSRTKTATLTGSRRKITSRFLTKTVECNAVHLHDAAISDDERRLTDLTEQLTTVAALLPKPAPLG